MKNVMISFLIFIFLIVGILLSINYLNKICTKLETQNNKIENYITVEDWNNANDSLKVFTDDWNKYSKNISIFIHHQELDDINIELQKLIQFVKYEKQEESQASLHTIKFYLIHISDMEKLNVKNIF